MTLCPTTWILTYLSCILSYVVSRVYVCMYFVLCTYTYMHVWICVYVYDHTHMYVCICIHTGTHTISNIHRKSIKGLLFLTSWPHSITKRAQQMESRGSFPCGPRLRSLGCVMLRDAFSISSVLCLIFIYGLVRLISGNWRCPWKKIWSPLSIFLKIYKQNECSDLQIYFQGLDCHR